MSDFKKQVETFLEDGPFAVVGASKDRAKYGNKVLRTYIQNNLNVHPVHPKETEIEGLQCYADLSSLPEIPKGVSIITPPAVTEKVVEEAAKLSIKNIWMQPGAESPAAVSRAEELGLNVIHGGPCVLVVLGFRED